MKQIIIVIFFLVISFPLLLTSQNEKGYKVKTIIEKEYQNIDMKKWKEVNNEWLYKKQKAGLSPLVYTCIIDTTQITEDSNGVKQIFLGKPSGSRRMLLSLKIICRQLDTI